MGKPLTYADFFDKGYRLENGVLTKVDITKNIIDSSTITGGIASNAIDNIVREKNKPLGMASKVAWKAGWRTIGGYRKYYRSIREANYARILQWRKEHGEILDWKHEPETFWFENIKRGVRSYIPDFKVWLLDGSIEYHEVKGWMDPKSRTKLKRMTKYYPSLVVRLYDDPWFRANRNWSIIISDWEVKS